MESPRRSGTADPSDQLSTPWGQPSDRWGRRALEAQRQADLELVKAGHEAKLRALEALRHAAAAETTTPVPSVGGDPRQMAARAEIGSRGFREPLQEPAGRDRDLEPARALRRRRAGGQAFIPDAPAADRSAG